MRTIHETIHTLEEFYKWRRGDETFIMPEPFELGVAIGDALRLLREHAAMKARAEKAEADTLRLDWLEQQPDVSQCYDEGDTDLGEFPIWTLSRHIGKYGENPCDLETYGETLRFAIDLAMKEANN